MGEEEDSVLINEESIYEEDNIIEEKLETLEEELLSQAAKQLMPSVIKVDSEKILEET